VKDAIRKPEPLGKTDNLRKNAGGICFQNVVDQFSYPRGRQRERDPGEKCSLLVALRHYDQNSGCHVQESGRRYDASLPLTLWDTYLFCDRNPPFPFILAPAKWEPDKNRSPEGLRPTRLRSSCLVRASRDEAGHRPSAIILRPIACSSLKKAAIDVRTGIAKAASFFDGFVAYTWIFLVVGEFFTFARPFAVFDIAKLTPSSMSVRHTT
jgi:hypothetical protein